MILFLDSFMQAILIDKNTITYIENDLYSHTHQVLSSILFYHLACLFLNDHVCLNFTCLTCPTHNCKIKHIENIFPHLPL